MLFDLNARQIRDGYLTDQDFSEAAGFEVKTFQLSEFPHFDELQRHLVLPYDKILERAEAIHIALKKAELTSAPQFFEWSDALAVANMPYGIVRSRQEPISLNHNPYFRHFQSIQKDGFQEAHREGSKVWCKIKFRTGTTTTDIFPGLLNENISFQNTSRKYAAFILRNSDISATSYWAALAKIPERLLINLPKDELHALHTDLHERRHLQQIDFEPQQNASSYYTELDADMYAHTALANIGATQELNQTNLHVRYIDMLRTTQNIGSQLQWKP